VTAEKDRGKRSAITMLNQSFTQLEEEVRTFTTDSNRTMEQIIAHLRSHGHTFGLGDALDKLEWQGWLVFNKYGDRGAPTEYSWRNMDPQPSYRWAWEEDLDGRGGWGIVGEHAQDRLITGTVAGPRSLITALIRLRHTITTITGTGPDGRAKSDKILFTLGDEQAVIALYEERFGAFNLA
jgi:hypothetical protein